jgi:hypothetical protein
MLSVDPFMPEHPGPEPGVIQEQYNIRTTGIASREVA